MHRNRTCYLLYVANEIILTNKHGNKNDKNQNETLATGAKKSADHNNVSAAHVKVYNQLNPKNSCMHTIVWLVYSVAHYTVN